MARALRGCGDAGAHAVDPLDFRYILGYVTLVEVELAPRRYRFRLDGSILAMLSGMDYTGKYLDQLGMPDYIDFVAASYDRVVDQAAVPMPIASRAPSTPRASTRKP